MKNKYILITAIIAIVGGGLWFMNNTAPVSLENPFSVHSTDTIELWAFSGTYKDGGELEERALSEITRLETLLGTEEYTDYEIYVSLAGQYNLLGEGKKVFEYLGNALAIDAENTGLAWHNMGKLMERLGAYESAKIAFNRAVEAQPLPVFYLSMVDFLEKNFPDDTIAINDAKRALGIPYEDVLSDE